jgi:hypothetical protein
METDSNSVSVQQDQTRQQPAPLMQGVGQPVQRPGQQEAVVPVAYGLQMKHRSPVCVWLLAIITLGIYGLVYWYKIHTELAEFDQRRHLSPGFEVMSIVLLGWTLVLPLMSIGSLAGKVRNAQNAAGLARSCSGLAGILFAFLFGTHLIYYQAKLNGITRANEAASGDRIALTR